MRFATPQFLLPFLSAGLVPMKLIAQSAPAFETAIGSTEQAGTDVPLSDKKRHPQAFRSDRRTASDAWVSAFEFPEHCRVSVAAFRTAVHALRATYDTTERAESVARLERVLASSLPDSTCEEDRKTQIRNYGQLVSRVDNARGIRDVDLAGASDASVSADSVPWTRIIAISTYMHRLTAMHANESHFQDSALFGFRDHHALAINLAARGQVLSALVVNSFADHYLQDQFAPGHIMTPRRGMHDATSASLHDHFNRVGLSVRLKNLDSLRSLLHVGSLSERTAAALRRYGCDQDAANCFADSLHFLGDGRIAHDARQELFITLVTARSVLDVLRANLLATEIGMNSFEPVTWTKPTYVEPTWRASTHIWTTPASTTPYSSYIVQERTGALPFNQFHLLQYQQTLVRNAVGRQHLVRIGWPLIVSPRGWRNPNRTDRLEWFVLGTVEGGSSNGRPVIGAAVDQVVPLSSVWEFGWTGGYRGFPKQDGNWRGFHIGGNVGAGYGVLFGSVGAALTPTATPGGVVREWGLVLRVSAFSPRPYHEPK